MKLTSKQKRAEIVQAIQTTSERIASLQSSYSATNPQVVEMVTKNKGYKAALEDVLEMFDGNLAGIRWLF